MGRQRLRVLAALAIGLASIARAEGPAERVRQLPPPGSSDWEPQYFRSIDRHSSYQIEQVEIRPGSARVPAYRAESSCSASGMMLPLNGIRLEETPILRWSWRVARHLDTGDERERGSDDFAARVYVLFRFDAEAASLRERLTHALSSRLAQREMPGDTLCYVWSSRLREGTSWTYAGSERTHLIVRASGSKAAAGSSATAGPWRHEQVDILSDAKRLLREDRMPQPMAIAIMTDSDDRCEEAAAFYADFSFAPRPLRSNEVHPEEDSTPPGSTRPSRRFP